MEGRVLVSALLILLAISMASQSAVSTNAQPSTWMEPAQPEEGDNVTFYCRAPGAYDVSFDICADDESMCYLQVAHGKTDSETWWVRVNNIPAGNAHYTVNVIYQNESTGKETNLSLEPQHFTVSPHENPGNGQNIPALGTFWVLLSLAVSAASIRAWRGHKR